MSNPITKEYAAKTLSATIAGMRLTAPEHNHLQECIRVLGSAPVVAGKDPLGKPKSALKPVAPSATN